MLISEVMKNLIKTRKYVNNSFKKICLLKKILVTHIIVILQTLSIRIIMLNNCILIFLEFSPFNLNFILKNMILMACQIFPGYFMP